ncbi:MAG: tRNA (guanosine(46)-N7)-methyltransferase TrmB [Clostridia bacterium]|nr:tRNA (guanosine(46)-N7)-methyltransferase TrmB [Clostridia bacterium]
MRMRKKSNLENRLETTKNEIVVCKSTSIYQLPESERYDIVDLQQIFSNDNPVYLEIGCGKGSFILENARRNPNYNYIGVEIISNVLISGAEELKKSGLKNVKFFNMGAELLTYTLPKHSISGLFLNFSCPYPKKHNENRRLTYKFFLDIYKHILKPDAQIIQKTDNDAFFEYSLNSFLENGFEVFDVTRDLYSNLPSDNIQTEYEQKFVLENKNINRLKAKLKGE